MEAVLGVRGGTLEEVLRNRTHAIEHCHVARDEIAHSRNVLSWDDEQMLLGCILFNRTESHHMVVLVDEIFFLCLRSKVAEYAALECTTRAPLDAPYHHRVFIRFRGGIEPFAKRCTLSHCASCYILNSSVAVGAMANTIIALITYHEGLAAQASPYLRGCAGVQSGTNGVLCVDVEAAVNPVEFRVLQWNLRDVLVGFGTGICLSIVFCCQAGGLHLTRTNSPRIDTPTYLGDYPR